MIALIDYDIICYSAGFAAQKTEYSVAGHNFESLDLAKAFCVEYALDPSYILQLVHHEPVENALQVAKTMVQSIVEGSGATDYLGFLSGPNNFREQIATIEKYKGNRVQEKPIHHTAIKEYLIKHHRAVLTDGCEADDALGVAQYEDWQSGNTILCSLDKDLNQIPGRHYRWKFRDSPGMYYEVEEIDGIRDFYRQMITGDTSDNIPGLSQKKPLKRTFSTKPIQNYDKESDMLEYVKEGYKDKYKGDWESAINENGALLWIWRYVGNTWRLPE